MQKKLKSSLMVASLVVAAAIIFAGCGDGEFVEISEKIQEIDLSQSQLINTVLSDCEGDEAQSHAAECEEKGWPSYSSEAAPSSSSSSDEPRPSSSSSEPSGQSSSSATQQQSSSSSTPRSSSSTQQQSSSSSAPRSSSSSTPQPAGGCKENNPKSGFTCAWNVTGTLTPGTTLKPAAYTLPDGCSSVAWKFAPDTGMATIYECEATNTDGFPALGSKNYVLFAELTCGDTKHTNACNPKTGLSSKEAPVLTGDCKWSKNPTNTANGGIPTGVSVVDKDNVCGSTKSVVYKYDGNSQTWPTNGILTEWKSWDKKHEDETYDVEAVLNCPAYPETVTLPCPPLKVSAGADYLIKCNGGYDNETMCGGKDSKTVNLKVGECVEVNVLGYTNTYYPPADAFGMRCNAEGVTSATGSLTLTVNGTAKPYAITGNSWNGLVSFGVTLHQGDNELGTLCLTAISNAASVKCVGPGQ